MVAVDSSAPPMPGGAVHPDAASPQRRLAGPGRALTAAGLAAVTTVTGYLYAVDPDGGGRYPTSPIKLLVDVDCPFCGGLRGTHALLNGRIGEALDHNLLLPAYLLTFAVILGVGALRVIGRSVQLPPVPRWLKVAAVVLMVGFAVVRNLPIDGLEYLASDA
jgi:hypothetical protein